MEGLFQFLIILPPHHFTKYIPCEHADFFKAYFFTGPLIQHTAKLAVPLLSERLPLFRSMFNVDLSLPNNF
jgi:hypothetical protein